MKPTHGLSVFDNPASVSATNRIPYEIDLNSVPNTLQFIQRGLDPSHYEIVPADGADLTTEEFLCGLAQVTCR